LFTYPADLKISNIHECGGMVCTIEGFVQCSLNSVLGDLRQLTHPSNNKATPFAASQLLSTVWKEERGELHACLVYRQNV
jgi:hypothetical protein